MSFDFSTITEVKLGQGNHASPQDGLCFMEMAAWFAGEKHTDKPECACPVLGAYGIRLNDAMPDELRDRLLKPLVPQIVGTRDSDSAQKRAEFFAMWAVNKVLPIILRARGFTKEADACERASNLGEARRAAYAAADAAYADAAYAAANANANAACAYAYAAVNAAVNAAANDAANDAADANANAACAYAYAAATSEQIWTVAVEGLRQAILIGRHEGLMIDKLFSERRENLRKLACADC
jgi:hypothetical protein